jgi:hypothetical protein
MATPGYQSKGLRPGAAGSLHPSACLPDMEKFSLGRNQEKVSGTAIYSVCQKFFPLILSPPSGGRG